MNVFTRCVLLGSCLFTTTAFAEINVVRAVQEVKYSTSSKSCPSGSTYCTPAFITTVTFVVVGQPSNHPRCNAIKFAYTTYAGGGGPVEAVPPIFPLVNSASPGTGGGGGGGTPAQDEMSANLESAIKNQHLVRVTYDDTSTTECVGGFVTALAISETTQDARAYDMNGNNLRDDIEAYLNRTYATNAALRSISEREARAIIAMSPIDLSGAANCHEQMTGPKQAARELDQLTALVLYNANLMTSWLTALGEMSEPGTASCTP